MNAKKALPPAKMIPRMASALFFPATLVATGADGIVVTATAAFVATYPPSIPGGGTTVTVQPSPSLAIELVAVALAALIGTAAGASLAVLGLRFLGPGR